MFIYSFYLISALLILFYFFTVDDARLLLGIYFHGFGNWEKIRLDERLGLTKKIAPVELQHHETFLPRAPNLKDRANALLEQVCNYLNFNFILPFVSSVFTIYNSTNGSLISSFSFVFFNAFTCYLFFYNLLITLHEFLWH